MAKYYGNVGYVHTECDGDGVWTEKITLRPYYGDVTKNTKRAETGEWLNDDINIRNEISIVADPYAYNNFFAIRFIEWMGKRWKVTEVEPEYPRLILSIGGVYNGPEE